MFPPGGRISRTGRALMHFAFYFQNVFQSLDSEMSAKDDEFHYPAKKFKIFCPGWKLRLMLLEEWNDNPHQIIARRYLIAVAVLMILAGIFLEVNIAASKEFFELVENLFIGFYQFQVKFRFYSRSSFSFGFFGRVEDVGGKTAFAVHQADNVIML